MKQPHGALPPVKCQPIVNHPLFLDLNDFMITVLYHHLVGVLSLLLLLTACATPYIPPEGYVPAPSGAVEACKMPWPDSNIPLRLRQTVSLDAASQHHIIQGVMLLDQNREQVRLVGLSEFGLKLFDLTIRSHDHVQHALSPVLGGMREALAAQIAQSVRRIFLSSQNMDLARIYVRPESTMMVHRQVGETVIHVCAPRDEFPRRIFSSPLHWEANLDEYQFVNDFFFPRRITYQDHRAGYSLVLVLHEVFEQ